MFAPQILTALLALAAQDAEASVDPLEAFAKVCIDGEATFAPGAIEPVEPGAIPRDARQAALLVLWIENYDYKRNRFVKAEDMPDTAFKLNSRDEAYLTPPSANPANPVQSSCILWAWDPDFEEVSRFLAEKSGREMVEIRNNTAAISYKMGSYRLKAGRLPGWTIISASPDDASALTEASS